jgi:acetylglutamate kinase
LPQAFNHGILPQGRKHGMLPQVPDCGISPQAGKHGMLPQSPDCGILPQGRKHGMLPQSPDCGILPQGRKHGMLPQSPDCGILPQGRKHGMLPQSPGCGILPQGRMLIVVKLGGEVVAGGAGGVLGGIGRDVARLLGEGARVIVTHGGGPQATALSKRLGIEPRLVGGRRITDEATLEVMKMTIAGQVNVDLCAALHAAGVPSVGLHGVVEAVHRPPRVVSGGGPEPIDFGHVGDPVGFDLALLERLLDAGRVPVVACLGHDGLGAIYNINADVVANQLAGALAADALVLVTSAPGVLGDLKDWSTRIPRLTVADGRRAIADGKITGGMIPKLEESFAALALGAKAIYIIAGELHQALHAPGTVGTVLHP